MRPAACACALHHNSRMFQSHFREEDQYDGCVVGSCVKYIKYIYVHMQENKWDWRKYISTIWWLCVVGSCVNEGLCDLLIWPAAWFTAYWKVTPIPPYQLQQISHLGEKRMVGVDKTAYCSNRCYWLNIVEVLNIVELKSMLSDIYWAQAAAKTLHWLLCKSVYFYVILVILVSQNREQCCSSSAPTGWFSDSSNTCFCTGGSNLGLHLQWGLRWGCCNTQYIIHRTLYIIQ